jgi:tetratricopeptide (TPR) repeat protein
VGVDPDQLAGAYEPDVFVSHASEDKARFVEPLVVALRKLGISVWYDSEQILLGDDFRRRMDDGLSRARFGVVILSPSFFKYWPQAELSALFTQEATFDVKRILPVRCDLDRATVVSRLPLLSARADVSWEMGVRFVAERIREVVRSAPALSRTARSPVYNLPSRRARQIFGREADLDRLAALLTPSHSVQVAATIEGLAGVGKTELALHVVNRLAETGRFPGGIFWFDAENPNLTTTWGSVIADALAVGAGTLEERAAAAVRIASSGAPVLVVLDNVERWTSKSEPGPLPRGPHTALLVTTRHKFLGGPSFEHFLIEVLPAAPAREFLISVSGRDLTRLQGIDDLLRHLDGHSLAIELAGAYLREFPSVTPAQYLKRLEEGSPVEEKVKELVRYEATVRGALDVHWADLATAAREALLIAACFAAEDATITLLEACDVDGDALQPLRRLHLITGDGKSWRMHRLVRAWVRRTAPPEDLARAKRKFVEGCTAYSLCITLEEGFRVYRADGKHLEQAVREVAFVLGFTDERVSELQNRLATALHSMGDLTGAKELLELTLASALKHLGEDQPAVVTSRSNLALVLQDLGDLPRAKELLELTLASALKHLGEDHLVVATSRSNLALVLKDLGDLPRAKELLELALASALKNLGENHSGVATRRSNLALVLRALGDLPRAKELLELALASDLKNLDEDHSAVASKRSNLALVLQDLGDLPRAKELLELSLASTLKNLGEDHSSVAVRRFNLASLSRDSGDLANARVLFSQTLAAEERSLGADHPTTSLTRTCLAEVLKRLGETELARAEAERAVRAVANQPVGSRFRAEIERLAAWIVGNA